MTAPTREELLARAEKYITINAPDGRGSALLVMELADTLRAGVAQKPSIDPADLWERYLAETENPSPQGAMAFAVEAISSQGASK